MDPLLYGEKLLAVISDRSAFESLFEDWLNALSERPFWSPSDPQGRRIPWRLAGQASDHLRSEFKSPGIYIFGASPFVLRYVGETGRSLKARLFGRYVTKSGVSNAAIPPQCLLAERFESAIREKGLDAFPTELVRLYKKRYRGGMARLIGAVDFVRHGLDGIWVTILPLPGGVLTKRLEAALCPAANSWNQANGFEPLCNVEHGFEHKMHLDGPRLGYRPRNAG